MREIFDYFVHSARTELLLTLFTKDKREEGEPVQPVLPLRYRLRRMLAAIPDSLGKWLATARPQVQEVRAQRMCPFCGLITPRAKRSCLECGKALGAIPIEQKM
jgi:hypothetical protein